MTRWVATSPNRPTRQPRRRLPYLGPPSYAENPRWGFPALAWRWPTTVPAAHPGEAAPVTVDRVRVVGGHASAMMLALGVLCLVSAGGEAWRYVLLLQSRRGALSDAVVATSDAVVTVGADLALAFAVVTAVVSVWWLHLARHAAAEKAEQLLARRDWQVLAYLLVPGVNLAMAGVILAELEHHVLHRPAGERPSPTRATMIWWTAWVLGGLLFGATVAWRFRNGVQAQADDVVLSALTDLVAAVVAVLTAFTIRRLSALLAPSDPKRLRRLQVVEVNDAPAPPLRPRPAHSRR
jgi:Domain of unknown function (DUF4328)